MIQSVQRALNLLNNVAQFKEPIGVRDLARACKLKVPTAQNLLKTLAASGYLDFDSVTHRYSVGLAALHLVTGVDLIRKSGDFARPYLNALFTDINETVIAGILHRNQLVIVDRVHSNHQLAAVHSEYIVKYPHVMASGKALLCYLDDAAQRGYAESVPWATMPSGTPASIDELLAALRTTREQGFGEVCDVSGSGIAAVAVPVWGSTSQPAMVIGCSAPMSRMAQPRMAEIRARMQALTGTMSAKLTGVLLTKPPEPARN